MARRTKVVEEPVRARTRKEKFVEEGALRLPLLIPKTPNQARLIEAIENHPLTVTTGFPGTGKTYVPTLKAAHLWNLGASRGGVDRIILARPNVESGRPLGYRPGDLQEKLREWFAEILSILTECLGKGAVDTALSKGRIEMVPFETMRGRSFSDAFIILDEAQNTTPHEMKMFVTRLGENIRCVVNGDVLQSDLRGKSGLKALVDIIRSYRMDVPIIEFGASDIVRSDICKEFILNFMDYESVNDNR